MKAAHNVLYKKKHSQTYASYPAMEHQLYAFKGLGVDLEVEGVCYIEMHHGPAAYVQARLLQGRRSRTRGRSQCVLVKIWRSTWNTYLVWCLNVVVI